MVRMGKVLLAGAIIALNLCGPPARAASAVSQDDVRHWLALWQRREGLENWDIQLEFVSANLLRRGKAEADVRWGPVPGTAYIRFSYPEEFETVFGYAPAGARTEAEEAIIHELMHLVLCGLYDDGTMRKGLWLDNNPGARARMEAITENLAQMLAHRHAPGGLSGVQYVRRQVNDGPWNPDVEVKRRIMLQVVRAMNAATEDDVLTLFAER